MMREGVEKEQQDFGLRLAHFLANFYFDNDQNERFSNYLLRVLKQSSVKFDLI